MAVDDDAKRLEVMMDEILTRLVAAFEAAGVELPERRYWTFQMPAADCEQLVVSFMQAYIGPVGDEATSPQRCSAPQTAQLDIQLLRCVPTIQPRAKAPTPEKIQAAAVAQARDAMILLNAACSLDTWDAPMGGPGMGVIATVDAGEPQGGFQGPTLHLTVAIP